MVHHFTDNEDDNQDKKIKDNSFFFYLMYHKTTSKNKIYKIYNRIFLFFLISVYNIKDKLKKIFFFIS